MKIAKLSLVAAVAVAGLTSASASSLEQAIKGVEVSGKVRYQYTQQKTDKQAHTETNRYDADAKFTVPVNDLIKAHVKFAIEGVNLDAKRLSTSGNGSPKVETKEAYFSFAKDGYTVTVGKQALAGPQTDGLNGTGIIATATPLKSVPVTLAAAYFNASSVDLEGLSSTFYPSKVGTKKDENGNDVPVYANGSGADIYAVAAIGSFQGVNAQAWLADVREIERGYALLVDGTVGPVTLAASYASKEYDPKALKDNKYSTLKVTADAKVSMFDVHAGYAKAGKNGTGELWDGNDAAVNSFGGEQVDITGFADGNVWNVGASVTPLAGVTVGLDYYAGKAGNTEAKETLFTAAYNVSKNFKVSGFYSNESESKTNIGRLEAKYSF